jgi:hypothetical protein
MQSDRSQRSTTWSQREAFEKHNVKLDNVKLDNVKIDNVKIDNVKILWKVNKNN